MAEKVSVRICLGSSCCSRGNGKNLVIIREFIEKNGLAGSIDFRGSVCAGKCFDQHAGSRDTTPEKK